ncbi:hypothetical protein [Bradyrhizobium sp. AUGA SZCCT0283]|uniref:hypothetical protein n=1 Tax=Bradyrhizobium sp. AUGA SZCCT0283 TaxID=2807671 RepID=UPI001BAC9B7B|nr:hypothetical protein [Bradyrhizobium sp. AUGA SZCCT0283]MBR1280118.1 hypothetical protein [Bradyrhizobium sp. AUGA SZCCT0283]
MRIVLTCLGLLLSIVSAQAGRVVAAGMPLRLYQASTTNPDCTSVGAVVMQVAQGPSHGRASTRQTGAFPNFNPSNPRTAN